MTGDRIAEALLRIRQAAEAHMDLHDSLGLTWSEEGVTEVAAPRGEPDVHFVPFHRRQENRVGADYLWWWIDEHHETSFGMLVQAKRLKRTSGNWTVDVRHNQGRQLRDLERSADYFNVPAMYAVYTGRLVLRRDLPCMHDADASTCQACERMAILLIGAWLIGPAWESPRDTASNVFNEAIALEDLVDPRYGAGSVWIREDLVDSMSDELHGFLRDDQLGPAEVAKRILAAAMRQRNGAFAAALAEPMTLAGELMFSKVPQDRGHYPGPYFQHFLRGLRRGLPAYVRNVLEGRPVSEEIANRVSGVILTQA